MKTSKILSAVILIVAAVLLVRRCFSGEDKSVKNPENKLSVCEENEKCYLECREDILALTALVEGFHEEPYFCGERWTIGYGTTVYPDGHLVTKADRPISKEYAQQCVYDHYDKHVLPWIKRYVKRALTKEQMLGVCSFIYNIGGENFSGYTVDGVKFAEPSSFLQAINSGKSDEETAVRMNGFRKSGGKLASGLPKRHWIEGAVYQGLLSIPDVYRLKPKQFYEENLSFYYKNQQGAYWTHDYSESKIKSFIQKNVSANENILSII